MFSLYFLVLIRILFGVFYAGTKIIQTVWFLSLIFQIQESLSFQEERKKEEKHCTFVSPSITLSLLHLHLFLLHFISLVNVSTSCTAPCPLSGFISDENNHLGLIPEQVPKHKLQSLGLNNQNGLPEYLVEDRCFWKGFGVGLSHWREEYASSSCMPELLGEVRPSTWGAEANNFLCHQEQVDGRTEMTTFSH